MLGRIGDEEVTLRPLGEGERAALTRRLRAHWGKRAKFLLILLPIVLIFIAAPHIVLTIVGLGVVVLVAFSIRETVWLLRDRSRATAIVLTSPRGTTERLLPSGRAWERGT